MSEKLYLLAEYLSENHKRLDNVKLDEILVIFPEEFNTIDKIVFAVGG